MSKLKTTTQSLKLGFSLIEILVVLSIFVVIVVITTQVFFSTLRGGSKSEATSLVRQEGSYVVAVIERALQGSKGIVSCKTDEPEKITYLDADGTQAYFELCKNGAIFSNSDSTALTTDRVAASSCSLSCTEEAGVSTLNVGFTLKRAGSGLLPREQTQLEFKTRVLLRN